MIHTLDTIMSEYYQHVDVYKKMQHDVEDIINTLIEANHIKISTMSLRIKSEQAFATKLSPRTNISILKISRIFSDVVF